mmetsp:Transcript_9165/g.13714  ORF Transcript_9165/g.13714 Transcript_9165/m.13714 type:complete len:254 (+) Transcript_9165:1559-2320(+)
MHTLIGHLFCRSASIHMMDEQHYEFGVYIHNMIRQRIITSTGTRDSIYTSLITLEHSLRHQLHGVTEETFCLFFILANAMLLQELQVLQSLGAGNTLSIHPQPVLQQKGHLLTRTRGIIAGNHLSGLHGLVRCTGQVVIELGNQWRGLLLHLFLQLGSRHRCCCIVGNTDITASTVTVHIIANIQILQQSSNIHVLHRTTIGQCLHIPDDIGKVRDRSNTLHNSSLEHKPCEFHLHAALPTKLTANIRIYRSG